MPSVDLQAPEGKFRVVGVDTFSDEDWIQGDYDTEQEAIDAATALGQPMLKAHVYDDQGRHLFEAGTF